MILDPLQVKFGPAVLKLFKFENAGFHAILVEVRSELRNELFRFVRRKSFDQVGAPNCDAFVKLLQTKALRLLFSKYISETNHSYQKFRALSRGVVIFSISFRLAGKWQERHRDATVTYFGEHPP